jgi:hypothetical protein
MALPAGPAARSALLRFPLPGGVEVVRLPSTLGNEVLDEALRTDAGWLVLDATGAEAGVETVHPQVARALLRSPRAEGRTCLVCRRRRLQAPTDGVTTFATVEDACQARLLEESGFGTGWGPPPLVVHGSRRLIAQ